MALWEIHGEQYDLTPLEKTHPGGSYILQVTRGSDCTALFETHHVTKTPHLRLPSYRAGRESRTVPSWDPRGVHRALREDVAAYVQLHGCKLTDRPLAFALFIAIMGMHLGLVAAWITLPPSSAITVGLAATMWLGAAEAVHSGTHGAISHYQWVNRGLAVLGTLFCPPFAWVRQHVTGHHGGVNTTVDPDVYHHPRRTHGWRVLASQAHYRAYKWWRFSLALGLWLTQLVPSTLHAGVVLLRGHYPGTHAKIAWAPGERRRAAGLYAALLAVHGYQIVRIGVVWAELPFMLCGACYYACSQVSHINEPSASASNHPDGWAVEQLRASAGDYSTGSPFTGWLSIGLNNQAVHHVFPSVHHVHYRHVAKIVRTRLRRLGIQIPRPHCCYAEALVAHLRYLRKLNDKD